MRIPPILGTERNVWEMSGGPKGLAEGGPRFKKIRVFCKTHISYIYISPGEKPGGVVKHVCSYKYSFPLQNP